jgi:uncharacterized membrane protein
MTEENQKSSKRQFWTSIIISIVALLIAIVALAINIKWACLIE